MRIFATFFETKTTKSTQKEILTIENLLQIKGGNEEQGGMVRE